MSLRVFKSDVDRARQALAAEERRHFWFRFLTLGLVSNRDRILAADQRLKVCRAELVRYESLLMQAERLDDLLVETIVLDGVRVSKHAFADIPVLDAMDYGVDWELLRDQVLARDGWQCQEANACCQGPLQIHHILPLSRGGSNEPENLVTLCFYHHCMKHDHMRSRYDGCLWC